MTSEERHELRYRRRKQKRIEKQVSLCKSYDDFNKVFTYEHLYDAYKKCILGVRWKASVQKYILNASMNIAITKKELLDGNLVIKNTYEFYLYERGKKRHIRSVGIKERVVQRCLCDYSLVPMLTRTFIYDNGASMVGKGVGFSRKRLKKHLYSFMKKHDIGYALVFDFKKYFDSIPHDLILEILRRHYKDERIISLIMYFIKFTNEDCGLDLGSQISQTLALAAANKIDHLIKDKLGFKYYGRYMDDGYIICESKEKLHECRKMLIECAASLGLKLNEKKTKIVKLTKGFVFLKNRYFIDDKRLVIVPTKCSAVRMRRKMKKLELKLKNGLISYDDILQSYKSWESHLLGTKSYKTVKSMKKKFNQLYIDNFAIDYKRYVG